MNAPHRRRDRAELPIGMCMDNRGVVRFPGGVAYIFSAGGTSLQRIGQDRCSMAGLHRRRKISETGLVENGGWDRRDAERHFDRLPAAFDLRNPAEFVPGEDLDQITIGDCC